MFIFKCVNKCVNTNYAYIIKLVVAVAVFGAIQAVKPPLEFLHIYLFFKCIIWCPCLKRQSITIEKRTKKTVNLFSRCGGFEMVTRFWATTII